MTDPVINWDNIHEGVLKALGEQRQKGWVAYLSLSLEEVKQDAAATGGELPAIVQIKQKFGGLRVYTSGGSEHVWTDIQSHVDRIEQRCEQCSNVADVQSIFGYATTLCSWCYARELERRCKYAPVRHALDEKGIDVAERFPDLVRSDCASLKPAVGPGWQEMISHYLGLLERTIKEEDLPLGTVQISDIKTNRNGHISIGFHRSHSCIGHVVSKMEIASLSCCAKCGHRGDIVRARDKSDLLCASCYVRSTSEWDPFEED